MPTFTQPLISVEALASLAEASDVVVVDCRFELGDPDKGRADYLRSHVPRAVYAHLDEDLSDKQAGSGGRHPLPGPDAMNERFSKLGISPASRVVVYDQGGGAIAGRLWWMLRYMGHVEVAVLDGGFAAWAAAGRALESGPVVASRSIFKGEPLLKLVVSAADVPSTGLLVDSRDGARYRGEHEPLDPVAGHIPGARHRFFGDNLTEGGRWRDSKSLRTEFDSLLADCEPHDAVFYCGSGVTACHNLLAMVHAGLPMARLYTGSWSDWCSDPSRAVSRGPERAGDAI